MIEHVRNYHRIFAKAKVGVHKGLAVGVVPRVEIDEKEDPGEIEGCKEFPQFYQRSLWLNPRLLMGACEHVNQTGGHENAGECFVDDKDSIVRCVECKPE